MIDRHWYYLLVNAGCLIVPFLFSFYPSIRFYRQWKALLPAYLVLLAVFIPWDIYFTASGIWGFNSEYTLGVFVFNLPLEEWLFFICIPYACVFTYYCFQLFIPKIPFPAFWTLLNWAIALTCIVIAFVFPGRWYTFTAHLLCGIFLLIHLLVLKSAYLNRFLLMFVAVFGFFLISNGILTGVRFWDYPFINTNPEAITEKIVWYNNSHNLGLRLFTMPADDIAYGLTMLLLITTVYERFRKPPVDLK